MRRAAARAGVIIGQACSRHLRTLRINFFCIRLKKSNNVSALHNSCCNGIGVAAATAAEAASVEIDDFKEAEILSQAYTAIETIVNNANKVGQRICYDRG